MTKWLPILDFSCHLGISQAFASCDLLCFGHVATAPCFDSKGQTPFVWPLPALKPLLPGLVLLSLPRYIGFRTLIDVINPPLQPKGILAFETTFLGFSLPVSATGLSVVLICVYV